MALPAVFVIPEFYGSEQDYENFVDQFVAYINLANINDNARILQNVLDNSGISANIRAIYIANAEAITGTVASFPNVPLGLAGTVAVNAGGGIPVILTGIQASQRLHRIKKHYPTANRYVKMVEIGSLKQGVHKSVASFWAKIQKPINDILDNLAELELHKEVLSSPPSYLNYIPTSPINPNIAPQQGLPSLLKIEESRKDYYIIEFLKDLGFVNKGEFDRDYPVKNFQRFRSQQNNNSARIDRLEKRINETQDTVNQLSDLFQKKAFIQKCGIFTPNLDSKENNGDDLGSEFGSINNLAIKALEWKADKPSNFTIKGNFKYITDSLGWYTDVPVTLKDKKDKIVTVIRNFVQVDNGESEPMLFFTVLIPITTNFSGFSIRSFLTRSLQIACAFSEDLKWRIVFLYYNGHNCEKIAELLYISKTTIKKVLQIYMRWDAVVDLWKKPLERNKTLTQDDMKILQELVKDKIDWYLDELVGELELRIGKLLHRAAYERNELFQSTFIAKVGCEYKPEQLIFMDEASKDERTLSRGYGIIAVDIMEGSCTKEKFKEFVISNVVESRFSIIKSFLQKYRDFVNPCSDPRYPLLIACIQITSNIAAKFFEDSIYM
ncbi:hypothetical protein C1646_776107 [Rhizophagus diaphanus]|nr:hypothetical protein C1646_776107 [Rhizophagus diaphanus] [Rhizophagus sp. MUCL 43196]